MNIKSYQNHIKFKRHVELTKSYTDHMITNRTRTRTETETQWIGFFF